MQRIRNGLQRAARFSRPLAEQPRRVHGRGIQTEVGEHNMKRFGMVGLAVAAFALVGASGTATGAAAQAARTPATITVNVQPVSRDGGLKPGYLNIRLLVRTDCYTGSDLFPGTYRCALGSNLFDPCWPRFDKHGVYHGSFCLTLPWQHAGIVLRGRHVALPHQPGRALWGLHTTDGYGCAMFTGAHDLFHGQPVFWSCDHGRRALLSMPDRTTAQWQITEVTYSNGAYHDPHRVGITKAWYAVSPFGA
jgi:hypothetical protein